MPIRFKGLCAVIGIVTALGLSWNLHADPAKEAPKPEDKENPSLSKKPVQEKISVAEARERAKLMHQIYSATLEVVHHHYFQRERATLPARAMEDVFKEIDSQSKIKARWISVNTPAMSINHNPETDFEKKAAQEIADGKADFERVEDGYYRRAGAIPLGVGCVGCHTKVFQAQAKTPRFAGLVISIPVKDK